MFTLGIPNKQYRRATSVLGHESAEPIEHDAIKQDDGFYMFSFPGVDEFDFKNIVLLLKRNGVTVIGADEQLTEKKIMKLTNLITEDFSNNLNEQDGATIIEALKNILRQWEMKQYPDDKTRWEEYYMDIDELVTDFEEEAVMDRPTSYALQEEKLRKVIRKMIRQ